MTAAKVDRLTQEQQSQALGQWGSSQSFRCCGCDRDAVRLGGVVATQSGFGMAVCEACDTRRHRSDKFRRKVARLAEQAAWRSTWQRLADLSGVSIAALKSTADDLRTHGRPLTCEQFDVRLGVPPGTVRAAWSHVMKAGVKQ
ncbi:hypothetical protein [Sphaerotilus mobilis]|uniref:hypothetical protein n=1 Tax=Sphaerotilus mobilis TaxID=47994 RepID=UPI00102C28FF|nr:hypothetical protein [Sphaerotilus mobilis]